MKIKPISSITMNNIHWSVILQKDGQNQNKGILITTSDSLKNNNNKR